MKKTKPIVQISTFFTKEIRFTEKTHNFHEQIYYDRRQIYNLPLLSVIYFMRHQHILKKTDKSCAYMCQDTDKYLNNA